MEKLSIEEDHKCSTSCLATYDYDLIVLGGGSGGIAAAKEAAELGAKVALVDFVTPTPLGTKWGLGGTCVNVGCIPKKLMHHASILGDSLEDSKFYGWKINPEIKHDWHGLVNAVQTHIKSVNWTIQTELADKNITYIHGNAVFKDPHTIITKSTKGVEKEVSGKYILIAIGMRPRYPDTPGAKEYAITSDDLFSLKKIPGKTLIVGGGYIALETAGFLNALGFNVTVLNRTSTFLRKLDQYMANLLIDEMTSRGVKFSLNSYVKSLAAKSSSSDTINVAWVNQENENISEEFNTVIFATGRKPLTKELQLEAAGVNLAKDGEKIDAINEQTNIEHIYAVGDVLYDKPELTPIAIQAGQLLSRRLFGQSKINMDYDIYGTTIFTPLEFGTVGVSEEVAISKFGEDAIEVYHSFYKPVEFSLPEKSHVNCYLKIVALREGDQKVLGMHYLGLNAGEIIQGFVTAIKCGLTIEILFNTIGIHITSAEEFIRLEITKRSGIDPSPAVCCS